jgi:tol-pal system protein YbgF
MAALLIAEEEERLRRRKEAEQAAAAASPDPSPAPKGSSPMEPAADAGLDEVFAEDILTEEQPREYPAAVAAYVEPRAVVVPAPRLPASHPAEPPQSAAPGPVAHPPVETAGPGGGGLELFHEGYSRFSLGDFAGASASFQEFLARHPGHELADNAQFWLGECAFEQKDFSTAAREYARVLESFPFSDRVPEAMLRSGLTLIELGRASEGEKILRDLVEEFPESGAARQASDRLK